MVPLLSFVRKLAQITFSASVRLLLPPFLARNKWLMVMPAAVSLPNMYANSCPKSHYADMVWCRVLHVHVDAVQHTKPDTARELMFLGTDTRPLVVEYAQASGIPCQSMTLLPCKPFQPTSGYTVRNQRQPCGAVVYADGVDISRLRAE